RARGQEAWSPRRDEAYLGVLVDDLITLGTKEPYRMFTSRAEYRLLLREDNADMRLTELGRELGLVDDARWAAFATKRDAVERESARLKASWVQPGSPAAARVEERTGAPLPREYSLMDLLKRPELVYADLADLPGIEGEPVADEAVADQVQIQAKYQGYIDRQQQEIDKLKRHEATPLPEDLDYQRVEGLSNEIRQKLELARPETLAQAGRISGVTPAAVSILLIHLKKRRLLDDSRAASA
ncbi:MAG: tRNA uridine-5-carboxymethylaminomethyl(34) synthesis enzyme MnmG, partial [Halomonas sp.]|nr:tRNA uridine-5-carboxymethylaminomethyl(34) synthesis enzyme MnmG [Halomonas sp.]